MIGGMSTAGSDIVNRVPTPPPATLRVSIFARDEELRGWLLDELMLMTWLGALELELPARVEDVCAGSDLAIVGLDALSPAELHALRECPSLIAIGAAPADLASARVLGARLTSRELKIA